MSKRGQNEGSIYKAPDGRWRGALSLGWKMNEEGQPVQARKVFSGRTRAEVQKLLTKALRDQELGLPVAPERQTVGQFLKRWLEDSAKPGVRPKTFDSYSQILKLYLTPALGRIPLAKLSPQHVQRLLNEMLQTRKRSHCQVPSEQPDSAEPAAPPKLLSARTVQYTHAVLRRALNQALRWGLVPRNVATLVDAPSPGHTEIQPFTPEQARAFLEAVKGDRLEALYSVAVAIGLRQGEALGLRWPDVDFDASTLSVRKALQRIEGKLQLVEPKTARSRRTINLPQVAVAALWRHRAVQERERQFAGDRWVESGHIFTTSVGTPLDGCSVNHQFQRDLKKAGLPRLRFHDLRHGCATLLLAGGVHPRLVMEILGHSQISLTMNTYSHVIPAMQKEVADRMDAILAPVATRVAANSVSGTVH